LHFHHHIHSRAANRIYQRTSFALLQERIHHNRSKLDSTSRELLEIHLCLATVLSKSDWSLIDQLTFNKATHVGGRQQGQTTGNLHGSTRHNINLQKPQKQRSST
jgi:hypothetical protein